MATTTNNPESAVGATERHFLRGFEPKVRAKLFMLWQKKHEAEPEKRMTWADVQEMLSQAMHELSSPKARPEVVKKCREDIAAGRVKTTSEYLEVIRGRIVAADNH